MSGGECERREENNGDEVHLSGKRRRWASRLRCEQV